jgi:electron transport complex protein RnfA
MNNLAALAVFSGLSLNLLIHLGIGIRDFNLEPYRPFRFTLFQWFALFASIMALWCLFTYIFTPLSLGFFEYFLFFPLIATLGKFWEFLFVRIFSRKNSEDSEERLLSLFSVHNGLVTSALLITIRLAGSFSGALALALGFSLGFLAAIFILRAILGRFSGEIIPPLLRGVPLLLISLGLLALIFSSLSVIILRLLKF